MRRAALVVVAALAAAGCKPVKRPTPCDPNPCAEENKTTCVVEGQAARCLCNPLFVQRPSGVCEALSLSNCPEHGGDTAEPDDCIARARPITSSDKPRVQSVEPMGDFDFFKLDALNRNVYSVTVKGATGPLMPRIDIFDLAGTWLDSADALPQAQLNYKARYGGLHYLRVSHSPFDPSVATGEYTVSVSSLGAEDHGDGPQEATSIVATVFAQGTTPPVLTGRFETNADQDWFTFSGSTGTNYTLAFNPQRLVPIVALYAEGNTQSPIWTSQQETTPFNLTSAGRYHLAMYPPAGTLTTTAYEFQFTR